MPVLAVVGRPNVGKSTLVNRIIGRREAVVEDVPGVTRDRVSYDANWNGRAFTVVDTGGWDPDARGLAERIAAQAEIAVDLADAVLFVVDATVGITDADEAVVKILRASKKPVVLAANKVDDQRTEAEAYGLWNLGLGEPYPVSALHGRGSGDMLDAVLAALPEPPPERARRGRRPAPDRDRRQAERRQVLAAEQAGRRGPGRRRQRRRHHRRPGRRADRARRPRPGGSSTPPASASGSRRPRATSTTPRCAPRTAIDRAEVAVLVLDGGESISEQDMRIIQTDPRGRPGAGHRLQQVGPRRRGAPLLPRARDRARPRAGAVGAADQRHRPHRLAHRPAGAGARQGAGGLGDPGRRPARSTRSSAGWSPSTRTRCAAASSRRSCSAPRPSTAPPTFVLFTSGKLDAGYERYIERRLREEFGFVGTPIVLQQRPREKRKR